MAMSTASGNYQKSSHPLYYGSSGRGPSYYGGPAYGSTAYGGTPYYAPGNGGAGDDESMIGSITIGRVIRVIAQRWILVLVALLIGLVVAFAVYRISPTIYEATSEFTMDMKRPSMGQSVYTAGMEGPELGSSFEEVLNTRMSDWRGDKVLRQIVSQYHADYPNSPVADEEIISTLRDSKIELVRHSRLITIAVRSRNAPLAAALANAYAKAIENYTDEENQARIDKTVAQIASQTEKQGRYVEQCEKKLLDFRMANKLDILISARDTLKLGLSRATSDILSLESAETAGIEWSKMLAAVRKDPDTFGSLPDSVPRSGEIATAYGAYQKAQMERNALLARYTANHPEMKAKEREANICRDQFVEVVGRAYLTSQGNLRAMRNQLSEHRAKRDSLNVELASIEQKIVSAQSGLEQLEREKNVASAQYQEMLSKLTEARMLAEQNNEVVRTGRPASVPKIPVLPQPLVIFPVGAAVGIGLGLFFVLALDHLEDTVIGIADIEQRLSLKVLAVLPHVRRKKREQVAKFIAEDKYSQFAEAVAGLRNLLDSPRYQMMSKVILNISTQPGDGKTITSCSIAISNAHAGKKTLLVDFDMRRPRLARVWNIKLDLDHSFSHSLQKNDASLFDSLVNPSGIDNLDIICSLPPENVNPASIMGSQIVADFFRWAREHYDRVIVDSPPYGLVGDVMTLATMVDSVLILCCPDRTRSKPIMHAARHLTEAGATILGVVVNDVDMSSSAAFMPTSRGYGYGYGYGGYGGYGAYGRYRPKVGAKDGAAGSAKEGAPAAGSAKGRGAVVAQDIADDD